MIKLKKAQGKNFVILNLTDFHLSSSEWELTHKNGAIINHTLKELFERVKPDLVTISGDIAWCGDVEGVEKAATVLDSFGVPYCVAWGNHDQDGGTDKLILSEEVLKKHSLFLYERGPEELGVGNYIIGIEENDNLVHSLIVMNSHDHARCFDSEGKEIFAWGTTPAWGKLYPEQIAWYESQVQELKKLGCKTSSLIMHIPCFAYREAFNAAFKPQPQKITLADSYKAEYWNEGYEGSFGVMYEGICSFPQDDGVFDALLRNNHTKNVIVGHDHANCFSVPYKGVRLTFALKAGAGSYWNSELNGGTTITVDNDGNTTIAHEIVDISHLL